MQDVVQFLPGVETVTGFPLVRTKMWEFRFPIPEYIGFETGNLAYLPYPVKELTRLEVLGWLFRELPR